jgi:hypothetical protein
MARIFADVTDIFDPLSLFQFLSLFLGLILLTMNEITESKRQCFSVFQ